MKTGTITKLVNTHGSAWGKIRVDDSARNVFFNLASLVEVSDFGELAEGQKVQFEEEDDQVNGTHALSMAWTYAL